MKTGLVVVAAMACGLLLAPMSAPSAAAAPIGKTDLEAKASDVTEVRRGGGGGGFRGGGGGGFRGGFRGGGGRGFHGGFRGGKGGFRGGHRGPRHGFGRHGGHGKHGRHRHRHGKRFYYAVPYFPYYYADDYYYYDEGSCEWLRQRALRTGSSYWWRRYDRCING